MLHILNSIGTVEIWQFIVFFLLLTVYLHFSLVGRSISACLAAVELTSL